MNVFQINTELGKTFQNNPFLGFKRNKNLTRSYGRLYDQKRGRKIFPWKNPSQKILIQKMSICNIPTHFINSKLLWAALFSRITSLINGEGREGECTCKLSSLEENFWNLQNGLQFFSWNVGNVETIRLFQLAPTNTCIFTLLH